MKNMTFSIIIFSQSNFTYFFFFLLLQWGLFQQKKNKQTKHTLAPPPFFSFSERDTPPLRSSYRALRNI